MTRQQSQILFQDVPSTINDGDVLHFLHTKDITWKHMNAMKEATAFTDDVLSDWLNISVKTLREYRKPQTAFKGIVKEQVLHLLSLFKHGLGVFGSMKEFENWLNTPNFYFDNKPPASLLNTVTGAKFVDDRLTAMEYGDNV